MKKIIITGPPFAGKSTVIRELEKQGYNVVHESARKILDSLRDLRFTDPHKEKRDLFQREVVKHQIKMEDENQYASLTFYDGGIVDSIAYYRLDRLKLPQDILDLANVRRYNSVFYFKSLEKVEMGKIICDEEERKNLGNLIIKAYEEFGYSPIEVPEMEVKKRVDFILENI